jgi:hypothetical protein
MPVTTLIRPDGSTIDVRAEDAGALKTLGYREQTAGEEGASLTHQAEAEYYNSPGQKIGTVIGGAASGLSFGLSDLAFGDEADRERARYNPGYRIGSELIGGLAAPTGVLGDAAAGLAEGKTASSALRFAAEGAQFGLGGEITSAQLSNDPLTIEGALAGVGWGGVFGGGLGAIVGKAEGKLERAMAEREALAEAAKADQATVAHTIPDEQWGGFKGTIDDTKARVDAAAKKAEAVVADAEQAVRDFKSAKSAPKAEEPTFTMGEASFTPPEAHGDFSLRVNDVTKLGEAFTLDVTNAGAAPRVRGELRAAQKELKNIKSAVKKGDEELAAYHIGEYSDHIKNIAELTSRPNPLKPVVEAGEDFAYSHAASGAKTPGTVTHEAPVARPGVGGSEAGEFGAELKAQAPSDHAAEAGSVTQEFHSKPTPAPKRTFDHVEPAPEPNTMRGGDFEGTGGTHGIHPEPVGISPATEDIIGRAKAAAKNYAQLQALSEHLASFPHTPEGLARLGTSRVEELAGAIDEVMKLPTEFAGVKAGLSGQIDSLVTSVGVKFDGTQGSKFRGVWETLRSSQKASVAKQIDKIARGGNLLDSIGGNAKHYGINAVAAKAAGFEHSPNFVYNTVRSIGWAMLSIKGAAVGAISHAATKYGPTAVRIGKVVAPRIDPLKRRLDSTIDNESKTRTELMKARSKEIYESGFGVKDTLYKGIAPMAQFHPEFAQGMHAATVAQFQFLLDKLPRDPGHAFNALKSLWHADGVATEKFARYYEVFHDPMGVINRSLETHTITVEAAEGLREMWPALFGELRTQMLIRLSDPKVRDSIGYNDQVHLGLMLDLPINSTMSGRFIASQQQMFTQRNQPLPMKPQLGADGGGGRPAGAGSLSTSSQAQKIEAH